MNNPLKTARELVGLTQKEVAQKLDISPQSIIRIERGTLKPSDKYLRWIIDRMCEADPTLKFGKINQVGSDYFMLSPFGLLEAWDSWKTEHRAANGYWFRRTPVVFSLGYRPKTHPLTIWRVRACGPKLNNFCNLLALHPYIVERYERGTSEKLPKELAEALVDAGLSQEQISKLTDACRVYAKFHNDGEPIPRRWI